MQASIFGQPFEGVLPDGIGSIGGNREAAPQHRIEDLLEMALGNRGMAIAIGDDLALFGEAHAALDRALGLRENGAVGRPAATADGAAAAMEDLHGHLGAPAQFSKLALGAIKGPGGLQKAAFLVAVRVADHDFLQVAAQCRCWR